MRRGDCQVMKPCARQTDGGARVDRGWPGAARLKRNVMEAVMMNRKTLGTVVDGVDHGHKKEENSQ